MKRFLLAGILAAFSTQPANTQSVQPAQGGGPSIETGTVPLTYTGGDSRVSIGVDQDGNSQGELMQVFGNNGEHAVVAQLWWGNGGAGGIQADYNWLFGTTLEQARQDPDSITVAKLSFAIDQNAEKDRQANVGLSIERKEFFLNFFLSGKASGARNAGAAKVQQEQIVSGTDDAGNYTQTKTDIATTLLLAQPYSTIVGIHGGHFSDALAARFNGGIDYAKGNQGANQKRVSLPTHGSVAQAGNAIVYTPKLESYGTLQLPYVGKDSFTYTISDNFKTATATVEVTLQPPPPMAKDDTADCFKDANNVSVEVLSNDTAQPGLPASVVSITPPTNPAGQLTLPGTSAMTELLSDQQVLYTSADPSNQATYTSDTFQYTIRGPYGQTATAKVTITILYP